MLIAVSSRRGGYLAMVVDVVVLVADAVGTVSIPLLDSAFWILRSFVS